MNTDFPLGAVTVFCVCGTLGATHGKVCSGVLCDKWISLLMLADYLHVQRTFLTTLNTAFFLLVFCLLMTWRSSGVCFQFFSSCVQIGSFFVILLCTMVRISLLKATVMCNCLCKCAKRQRLQELLRSQGICSHKCYRGVCLLSLQSLSVLIPCYQLNRRALFKICSVSYRSRMWAQPLSYLYPRLRYLLIAHLHMSLICSIAPHRACRSAATGTSPKPTFLLLASILADTIIL